MDTFYGLSSARQATHDSAGEVREIAKIGCGLPAAFRPGGDLWGDVRDPVAA
jgi:hypothetical protein